MYKPLKYLKIKSCNGRNAADQDGSAKVFRTDNRFLRD
jgi:hypothetical protein